MHHRIDSNLRLGNNWFTSCCLHRFSNTCPSRNSVQKNTKMNCYNRSTISLRTIISTTVFAVIVFLILQAEQIEAGKNRGKSGRRGGKACKKQVSTWKDCSKTCGLGLSSRVKTKRCKPKLETRLCILRPCENGPEELPKPRKACMANLPRKDKQGREFIKYIKAKSQKKYRMRYCGYCKDNSKCCTPKKSKTKKVWFVRADGTRFSKKMMFIRKCYCHRNCNSLDNFEPHVQLHNDTMRSHPTAG